MLRFCLLFAALFAATMATQGALEAQQVASPTPEQVGPVRGENTGNYNITQSFEIGYRWSLVGGDLGEYRSDVNYRNGLRLLGSNFTINSKDGEVTAQKAEAVAIVDVAAVFAQVAADQAPAVADLK